MTASAFSTGMPNPVRVFAALAMSPEWNAFCTWSLAHLRPAAFNSASSAFTASTSPEITACNGELTAASHKPLRSPLLIDANSSSDHSETESMAPSSANVSVDLARTATMPTADSKDSSPPAMAATYSPREWPATATGAMPTARSTWASEYSTTKRLGCVMVGCANFFSLSFSVAASEEKMVGRRSKPKCSGAMSNSQHLSAEERNRGT
mmetsp:Transcript_123527/g.395131  ORF Transcript_123527/g.395131 Transcript_123527/m.395131 type:complete len:209 (-) Transcript_123527:4596-5222(-)